MAITELAIGGLNALAHASEEAAEAGAHGRSFADTAAHLEQAPEHGKPGQGAAAAAAKPAEKSWWDSAKDAVNSAASAVDAGAHRLGDAAIGLAEAGIERGTAAVRSVAGDGVADVLHGAAEGVRETARQAVGFTYGVGAGATEAVGGMVEGTGDLIGDGVRMATDPAFRGQVVQGAEALAEHVAADPLGTAKAVGSGVLHAGEDWVRGAGRAAQEGNLGEYLGRGVGSAAVNVGSFFIPGAGEAEAANIAGHAGEAGAEALAVAGSTERIAAGAQSAAQTVERNSVDLGLTYKPGWTAAQRAEADSKVRMLSEGDTVVTQSSRSGTSAASRYRKAGNDIPPGCDIDHAVDLQLGGSDTVSNMWPLNSSVNRSLGSQIHHQIKELPYGTIIDQVTIGER